MERPTAKRPAPRRAHDRAPLPSLWPSRSAPQPRRQRSLRGVRPLLVRRTASRAPAPPHLARWRRVTLTMTTGEREAFLAGLHVAVLSVDDPGRGPHTIPVWYSYAPGGTVSVVTGGQSVKAQLLRAAGRFSLCVQSESMPYRYVSVEGPITALDEAVSDEERRALAQRYLGAEGGDLYVASTAGQAADSVAFRMAPERWRTSDYGKLG